MDFSGNNRKNKQVPEPTLRRLPVYLYFLEKVREEGTINISAPTIGKNLKCDFALRLPRNWPLRRG